MDLVIQQILFKRGMLKEPNNISSFRDFRHKLCDIAFYPAWEFLLLCSTLQRGHSFTDALFPWTDLLLLCKWTS